MPRDECDTCGNLSYLWSWEEAFYKFGFNDGDGQVETWQVEAGLTEDGYEVTLQGWALHNTVILPIKESGRELIPHDDPKVTFGYDDPRTYLPSEIVELLDKELPDDW